MDGEENSSKEFSKADIKAMIQRQQDTYHWHFTFLGANQDAFAEAGGMGIAAARVANFAMDKMAAASAGTGGKVARVAPAHGSGRWGRVDRRHQG
jgi:hypothetical protein